MCIWVATSSQTLCKTLRDEVHTDWTYEAVKIPQNTAIQTIAILLVTAALRSRCGHYIFALWFLSIFLLLLLIFSSLNLSGRRLDVYHTSTHGVALVRI